MATFKIVVYTLMRDHLYARLVRPGEPEPPSIVYAVTHDAPELTNDVRRTLVEQARQEGRSRRLNPDSIIGLEPHRDGESGKPARP